MTWLVSKNDTSIRFQPWDVRHTINGKWAITTRSDEFYGNAFGMAEEVFDGKRWRPITDVQQSSKPVSNDWNKLEFILPIEDDDGKV